MRAAILACALLAIGAAQPRNKSKLPPLPVGSEASVRVVGDEARMVPGVGRAGVVSNYGIVVTLDDDEYPSVDAAIAAQQAYRKAIFAGDPDGIQLLVERGQAVKVPVGTKVRVLGGYPAVTCLEVPCDSRGSRIARVIDGPLKGKVIFLPARNLIPVKTSTPRR